MDLVTTTGEITVPIGGKPRTFKFGMLTLKLLENESRLLSTTIEIYGATLWAGLMVRESVNDLPKDFSVDTVLDWMDDIDEGDLAKVLALSEKAFERIPNVNARVDGLLGRERDASGAIIPKNDGTPSRKEPSKSDSGRAKSGK